MQEHTIKIALVGNPNAGKSLVFSRITGINVISANYAGTTVEIKKGMLHYLEKDYEILDMPGIYSLEAFSSADEAALRLIDEADIIVNIVDATTLERNLTLTLQLLSKRKPMVVCLNFWDDTKHKGVALDARELERILDIPVVTVSALRNEGVSELVASFASARASGIVYEPNDQWTRIGFIVNKVQKLSHRHHTFWEFLSDATLHPVGGIIFALVIMLAAFVAIRFLGEGLSGGLFEVLYSQYYFPFISRLASIIPWKAVQEILVNTGADPLQSFSILTSGVYIAFVLVFPYFFSFYLAFGFLEDIGYLPRLAVILDPLFHRLGLHGHSSIPIMLGLGCKVPAFLSARVLTDRREKILTMALCLMAAPCLPQSAMIASLGLHYGFITVGLIFSIVLIVALCMNTALNKLLKGAPPELFIELPSYRLPSFPLLCRKLWIRIIDYFREIFPLIVIGVLIIHVLDSLNILRLFSQSVGVLLSLLLGLPRDIAPVLFLGFLRKDVSIALLAPFHLSASQFVVASIFMVLYLPCIASLFVLIREIGFKTAMQIVGLSFVVAILISSIVHFIFAII